MPYQAIMRNITIGLFEQRRPRLKKGLAMQPVLLSAGTPVNTATHGWNLTASGGTFVLVSGRSHDSECYEQHVSFTGRRFRQASRV